MELKKLDKSHADDFLRLRINLLHELGEICGESAELKKATKEYYLSHIGDDLICFGAYEYGSLVSIGSLCLFERIPYGENLSGKEGYILNVYTEPEFRNHGLAKQILNEIIKYASDEKIGRLWLNASESGELLYTKLGFAKKGNEMELIL